MLYINLMVMSFPFITVIEHNEKLKRKNALELSSNLTINNRSLCKESKKQDVSPNKEELDKYQDMAIMLNYEEICFQPSPTSPKCLMRKLFPEQKNKKIIDYDKYLDFFE